MAFSVTRLSLPNFKPLSFGKEEKGKGRKIAKERSKLWITQNSKVTESGTSVAKMMKLFGRGKDTSDVSPQSFSYSSSPSSSAAPVTGPERPIRLIYCDESGKFRMDPEAVATLQLVKEPIGIVSVCGRARQGKSFILNQVKI